MEHSIYVKIMFNSKTLAESLQDYVDALFLGGCINIHRWKHTHLAEGVMSTPNPVTLSAPLCHSVPNNHTKATPRPPRLHKVVKPPKKLGTLFGRSSEVAKPAEEADLKGTKGTRN